MRVKVHPVVVRGQVTGSSPKFSSHPGPGLALMAEGWGEGSGWRPWHHLPALSLSSLSLTPHPVQQPALLNKPHSRCHCPGPTVPPPVPCPQRVCSPSACRETFPQKHTSRLHSAVFCVLMRCHLEWSGIPAFSAARGPHTAGPVSLCSPWALFPVSAILGWAFKPHRSQTRGTLACVSSPSLSASYAI